MGNRNYAQGKGYLEKGVTTLFANMLTTTSGTLSTASGTGGKGLTVAKIAGTGKYTITLTDRYVSLLGIKCTVLMGASAGVANAKGAVIVPFNKLGFGTTVAQTVDLQALLPNGTGYTAGEVDDGATILVELTLKDSTV